MPCLTPKQSDFYPVHKPMSKGKALESVFATTDEKYHAMMRRCVANAFSMSSIVHYEARVNETSRVFLAETERRHADTGKPLDFTFWLQLFAFDVITEITYSKTLGFVEKGGDIEGILAGLEKWFCYVGPVGNAHSHQPRNKVVDKQFRLAKSLCWTRFSTRIPSGRCSIAWA